MLNELMSLLAESEEQFTLYGSAVELMVTRRRSHSYGSIERGAQRSFEFALAAKAP